MTSEAQNGIQKFLYNLSTENYAKANENLNKVLSIKLNKRFSKAYESVKRKNHQNK